MSRNAWRRVAMFAVSLFLFILAIMLMKEGARGLGPLVRDVFRAVQSGQCAWSSAGSSPTWS